MNEILCDVYSACWQDVEVFVNCLCTILVQNGIWRVAWGFFVSLAQDLGVYMQSHLPLFEMARKWPPHLTTLPVSFSV